MCGRFARHSSTDTFSQLFDAQILDDLPPSFNVAPSQHVLTARNNTSGGRELVALVWGLIPAWSKGPDNRYSMINARAETVANKPAYRAAFKQRRCLFAVDGFYEWQRTDTGKQPFYIGLADHLPFAMAGLWERWQNQNGDVIESCAVITTEANALVADIHDRMPVILAPDDYAQWLQGADAKALTALLRPFPAQRMQAYPVSTRVNNPRNNDPECAKPLDQ